MKVEIDESLSKSVDDLNKMFDELVPSSGKASTVAGEIVRAVTRIGYRYLNDGDRIGIEYGNETCNAPARYLQATVHDSKVIHQIDKMWGTLYKDRDVDILVNLVVDYLDKNPELKTKRNHEDMWDYFDKYEDQDYFEDDEEDW